MCVCVCVCVRVRARLNFPKTNGRTSIKLGAIDHHPEMSVIRGFVTDERGFYLKQKLVPDLLTSTSFVFLGSHYVIIND